MVLFPEYQEGLQDLEGFSHLFLIYHFHLSQQFNLKVTPFLDITKRGVFATRAPARPNSIGLSVVRLERLEGCTLHVLDVDVVDGTPILDIKPYVPAFDVRAEARIGWLGQNLEKMATVRADERFLKTYGLCSQPRLKIRPAGGEEAGVAVSAPGPVVYVSVRRAEKKRRTSREFPALI